MLQQPMGRMVSCCDRQRCERAADASADEIDNLKKEAAAFREVRKNVGDDDGPRKVFDKVS